ncbi:HD domain-containing protein [Lysobacter brunescens]|uniref:Metal-dependent HD superfamily phosphohydrolase n=1 Tax=Lysobacter brunescens TaxID=262323 RepID=A0ABW2YD61_9GAMM
MLGQLPADQLDALRAAYADPPRAYHHFGHVREVLGHYRAVADGPGWHRPGEVLFAVLYHDAVYVPGRSDNEAASAQLAVEHLSRWPPATAIDANRVSELILLTARHGAIDRDALGDGPDAEDARRFLDCDMAILAADPDRFAAYDREIAEEYRAVPRWLYRIKRRQFFRRLLASERIYLSDHFHGRLEARARVNLAAALAGR